MVCGPPEEGTNTVPIPAEVNLVFGEQYVYSCLSGYQPASVGMVLVTECMANGSLSLMTLPICTGKFHKQRTLDYPHCTYVSRILENFLALL